MATVTVGVGVVIGVGLYLAVGLAGPARVPVKSPPAGATTAAAEPATPAIVSTQAAVVATPTVSAARFDAAGAQRTIRALAAIGVRKGGSANEHRGADLIVAQLRAIGYEPEVQTFKLPDGATSQNVIARAQGNSGRVIVLGAHMDSKSPSPGANDNASGCAALLEIARNVNGRRLYAGVEFVFFGTEEMVDSNPNHHHYGSRCFAGALSAAERNAVAGMVSVDMIGFGSKFASRTMGTGPQGLSDLLIQRAKAAGMDASYLRDPSAAGYSDHEAFERLGIPVSWIEWRTDPVYHTAADTPKHINADRLRRAGQLVLDFVLDADEAMLKVLKRP